MAQRFDKNEICNQCGQHRAVHRRVEIAGTSIAWTAMWCPDGSLPDPNRDDDPWEPSVYEEEAPVARLFDSYT